MINPFSAVKTYFTVKSQVKEIAKEATAMNGTKPGWKTTEFWFNAMTQIATLFGAVQGFIPPKYAAIISTSGIAVYTIARTILKAVTDVKAQTVSSGSPAVAVAVAP